MTFISILEKVFPNHRLCFAHLIFIICIQCYHKMKHLIFLSNFFTAWISKSQWNRSSNNQSIGFDRSSRKYFCLQKQDLQTNSRWCHGFILYTHLSQCIYVEMVPTNSSPTRNDWWRLWSVSILKNKT